MKSSDEIKKGLECCLDHVFCAGEGCPYYKVQSEYCDLMSDALALIRQLQEKNEAMHEEIVRLQAERDAAVADLMVIQECSTCKYDPDDPMEDRPNVCYECCTTKCNYEWRGVQKGDMFGLVKDAPAVESMPRWISVEERMPEPKEDVALYIRCGDVSFIRTGWRMRNGQFICPNDSLSGYEVTHWMPLPEPPKEAAP